MRTLFVLPALLLVAGVSSATPVDTVCGTVSVFFDGPQTQDLYPAQIGAISGKNKLLEVKEHRLVAGAYDIKVYEAISAPELRVDNRHRGYSKTLKVLIEPNKVYHIGAHFNHLKPFDRNEFWEPVVWKVTDRECTIKSAGNQ